MFLHPNIPKSVFEKINRFALPFHNVFFILQLKLICFLLIDFMEIIFVQVSVIQHTCTLCILIDVEPPFPHLCCGIYPIEYSIGQKTNRIYHSTGGGKGGSIY